MRLAHSNSNVAIANLFVFQFLPSGRTTTVYFSMPLPSASMPLPSATILRMNVVFPFAPHFENAPIQFFPLPPLAFTSRFASHWFFSTAIAVTNPFRRLLLMFPIMFNNSRFCQVPANSFFMHRPRKFDASLRRTLQGFILIQTGRPLLRNNGGVVQFLGRFRTASTSEKTNGLWY